MPKPEVPPGDSLKGHLLAWTVVGIGCGWFGLPSISATSLLAFGLSGSIIGAILGIATYPLSRQPILILVGAAAGAVLGCLGAWFSPAAAGNNLPGLCLMIGSMIGSTARIWQTPLKLLQPARQVAASH